MNSKTKSLTIFTLFMAFLISIFGFGFTGAINNNAIADEQAIGIAVINGETYTFDEAINKANEEGGEVTIEISGKVEYTASTANLNDALDVINFVGKTVDAQISITRNGSNGDNAVSVSSMVLTSVMIVLNVLVVLWVGKKLRKK